MTRPPERPILFSGPMVRAILAGTKTQTRRVVSGDNRGAYWDHRGYRAEYEGRGVITFRFADGSNRVNGIDGMPFRRLCPYDADRLWVRETWAKCSDGYLYRARGDRWAYAWKPSIHMPRDACRITLPVLSIRVERLQDITEADALAEGCESVNGASRAPGWARSNFETLWQSINGERPGCSWAANPWVWRVAFSREARP